MGIPPRKTNPVLETFPLPRSRVRTLRLRVLSTWKGRMCLASRSHATDSQSRMNDWTPDLAAYTHKCAERSPSVDPFRQKTHGRPRSPFSLKRTEDTRWTRSGYLPVRFSELRLKIMTCPFSSLWIWLRSPSYLYSQVNRMFSKRSSTSEMLLVGCASVGLTGMPARGNKSST